MCQITMKIPNAIGYCAEIAEMPENEFIRFLGTQGISVFRYDGEEEFLKEYVKRAVR